MDKNISTTNFQPSAAYSLMSLDNETNPETDRGKVTNWGETYNMLNRNYGKNKTMTRQTEQLEGYSRLFSN